VEAIAQQVITVLGLADFNIRGELRVHGRAELSVGVEGFAQAKAEESGFEAGGAEDGLLGEGDALDGEEFLGVDGVVDGDEVLPEVGDFIEVFQADDGEAGSGEAVFAGVLGRAGLAFRGAGAGGAQSGNSRMATPRPASMLMLSRFWMSQPAAVSKRSMLARARSSGRPAAGMGMGGRSVSHRIARLSGCRRNNLHWEHMENQTIGLVVDAVGTTGVLHQVSGVIARHQGDITSVDILVNRPEQARTYFEVILPGDVDALVEGLRALPIVRGVEIVKTLQAVYGKRIIIMGGGAQVGQVAIGAISEADRHNIRGERISVDTIPLVGEQKLADAVRAVARLPRAKALVLAGSLMGGEIETAVREVRRQGLLVVSLNMAGSVPDAADLVVTDPVQAGVMAVMAVADTAKFTVERLKRRVF